MPPPADHDDPDEPPPPSVLEYERPGTVPPGGARLSAAAVTAFAIAVFGAVLPLRSARGVLFGPSVPFHWVEALALLMPFAGVFVSVDALLRIADQKNRLRGDLLAWVALALNAAWFLGAGCCLGLRWTDHLM
jgi:hypothetical protein